MNQTSKPAALIKPVKTSLSEKIAFSWSDFEQVTSLHRKTGQLAAKAGQLKVTKIGRRTLILREEVMRWLESRTGTVTELASSN